ncbi:hypothetical protein M1D47_22690 [Bacillus sp. R1-10]
MFRIVKNRVTPGLGGLGASRFLEVSEEELMLITDTVHSPIASSIKEIQTRTLLVFHSGCAYQEKFEQCL